MKHAYICMKSTVCLILTKPGVARQIFVKGPNIKFMEIHPVGAALVGGADPSVVSFVRDNLYS